MRQVDDKTLEDFAQLCGELEREAAQLESALRRKGEAQRLEGAQTVRANARRLRERAEAAQLTFPRSTALPLSRPFGEWEYGPEADRTWELIQAVDDFWDERLGGGVFEVCGQRQTT